MSLLPAPSSHSPCPSHLHYQRRWKSLSPTKSSLLVPVNLVPIPIANRQTFSLQWPASPSFRDLPCSRHDHQPRAAGHSQGLISSSRHCEGPHAFSHTLNGPNVRVDAWLSTCSGTNRTSIPDSTFQLPDPSKLDKQTRLGLAGSKSWPWSGDAVSIHDPTTPLAPTTQYPTPVTIREWGIESKRETRPLDSSVNQAKQNILCVHV